MLVKDFGHATLLHHISGADPGDWVGGGGGGGGGVGV